MLAYDLTINTDNLDEDEVVHLIGGSVLRRLHRQGPRAFAGLSARAASTADKREAFVLATRSTSGGLGAF